MKRLWFYKNKYSWYKLSIGIILFDGYLEIEFCILNYEFSLYFVFGRM